MSDAPFNFFGVLFNPATNAIRVSRIRLNAALQNELSEKFAVIDDDFRKRDVVDYKSTFYRVGNELIRRAPFNLPAEYAAAFSDIQSVPPLRFPLPTGFHLKAIVAHRPGESLFQGHTAQRELSKNRWALVPSGDTFSRFEDTGLMVGGTLAASVRGAELFINTFSQVRDVLRLTDMYRQASDGDIRTFLSHDLFSPLDQATTDIVVKTLGTTARKRITNVLADGVLGAVTVQQLREYAARYPEAATLTVVTAAGTERVVLPTAASGVSKIIDLLTGSFFTHELSGQPCATNSYRPLGTPAVVSLPSSVKDEPAATDPQPEQAEPKKPKAAPRPRTKKPATPKPKPDEK
jgi:hypothetical protein